jgi:hypothetical protein
MFLDCSLILYYVSLSIKKKIKDFKKKFFWAFRWDSSFPQPVAEKQQMKA